MKRIKEIVQKKVVPFKEPFFLCVEKNIYSPQNVKPSTYYIHIYKLIAWNKIYKIYKIYILSTSQMSNILSNIKMEMSHAVESWVIPEVVVHAMHTRNL